jgi:hypothetical protein
MWRTGSTTALTGRTRSAASSLSSSPSRNGFPCVISRHASQNATSVVAARRSDTSRHVAAGLSGTGRSSRKPGSSASRESSSRVAGGVLSPRRAVSTIITGVSAAGGRGAAQPATDHWICPIPGKASAAAVAPVRSHSRPAM